MKRLFICAAAMLAFAIAVPPGFAAEPKQGGAAVITFNNDLTTLDPQVGYDWQNWSVIKSIFDGLMDYKPGSTELEVSGVDTHGHETPILRGGDWVL